MALTTRAVWVRKRPTRSLQRTAGGAFRLHSYLIGPPAPGNFPLFFFGCVALLGMLTAPWVVRYYQKGTREHASPLV